MNKSIYIFALLFTASTLFISCNREGSHVSVTGIALSETELTMTVGDPAVTLIATVRPNNATDLRVTWESDDTDVAIVNANGVVTAVSAGTTTITATTTDGNFTATCEVTVTPVPILVTGISISGRSSIRLAIGATDQFHISIEPNNATNRTITWHSSNTNVATIATNGTITALQAGITTISATAECGLRTATGTVAVEGIINISSSIDGIVIDGTRWATRNMDTPGAFAQSPTDIGMLYQWNRRQGWAAIGDVIGWDSSIPTGAAWYVTNDPCPEGWRVPTIEEFESLYNVANGRVTHNDVNGRIFGAAPNQIFLPSLIGRSPNGALAIWIGGYWSSQGAGMEMARIFTFHSDSGHLGRGNGWRVQGHAVRCVAE